MRMARSDQQEVIGRLLVNRNVAGAATLADIRRELRGRYDSEWE